MSVWWWEERETVRCKRAVTKTRACRELYGVRDPKARLSGFGIAHTPRAAAAQLLSCDDVKDVVPNFRARRALTYHFDSGEDCGIDCELLNTSEQ